MRNKLQPSGRKAIMVGYLRERKAYRLFDIERESIVEERNVTFIENQKGDYKLKKKEKVEYFDWNIEYLIDTPNDNNLNKGNKSQDEIDQEEQGINSENKSEIENENIQDRIDNQDQSVENRAQNNEIRKVGRPKGLTSVESMKRKEKELKEREDRLKEKGVRRSARLNKKKCSNSRKHSIT